MANAYVLIGYDNASSDQTDAHPLVVFTDEGKAKEMLDKCESHTKSKPADYSTRFSGWASQHPLVGLASETYVTFDCFDVVTIPLL